MGSSLLTAHPSPDKPTGWIERQPFRIKLLLLAFLGLAGASQIYNPLWLQKEHVFEYVSAVISGIPELGAQYAGLRIHAEMRVKMFGDHASAKSQNARYKTYNTDF